MTSVSLLDPNLSRDDFELTLQQQEAFGLTLREAVPNRTTIDSVLHRFTVLLLDPQPPPVGTLKVILLENEQAPAQPGEIFRGKVYIRKRLPLVAIARQ